MALQYVIDIFVSKQWVVDHIQRESHKPEEPAFTHTNLNKQVKGDCRPCGSSKTWGFASSYNPNQSFAFISRIFKSALSSYILTQKR